jgi:hypothetical protein
MLRSTNTTIVAVLALTTALGAAAPAQTIDSVPSATAAAEVRVVHGSPDAGPVTVAVDGIPVVTNFLYGTVTPYVSLKPGTYTLSVTTAAKARVSLKAKVAAGTYYSVVATGELSPKASPKKPNIALTAFVDKPFGKSVAINFHHAAPAAQALAKLVPFGIGALANPKNELLGSAKFGTETGPLALPASAVGVPLELYAVSVDTVTLIPNQIAPSDFRNVLPATAGRNLSAFAIDGPAAASVPSISGTDAVRLVGAFDAAGI